MVVRVDATQLGELAVSLRGAGDRLQAEVGGIFDDAGQQLRDEAKRLIRSQIRGVYLPHYPDAITDETRSAAGGVETEVGPESGRLQGGMGPGVEYGSARTGPLPHLIPALERIAPEVERRLADAAATEAL